MATGAVMDIRNSPVKLKERLRGIFSNPRDALLLDRVQERIPRVREPLERPREDMSDPRADVYLCDVCLSKARSGEINQCPYCGRWMCLDKCLDEREGACRSCASQIRLHRESILHLKDMTDETGPIPPSPDGRSSAGTGPVNAGKGKPVNAGKGKPVDAGGKEPGDDTGAVEERRKRSERKGRVKHERR